MNVNVNIGANLPKPDFTGRSSFAGADSNSESFGQFFKALSSGAAASAVSNSNTADVTGGVQVQNGEVTSEFIMAADAIVAAFLSKTKSDEEIKGDIAELMLKFLAANQKADSRGRGRNETASEGSETKDGDGIQNAASEILSLFLQIIQKADEVSPEELPPFLREIKESAVKTAVGNSPA